MQVNTNARNPNGLFGLDVTHRGIDQLFFSPIFGQLGIAELYIALITCGKMQGIIVSSRVGIIWTNLQIAVMLQILVSC